MTLRNYFHKAIFSIMILLSGFALSQLYYFARFSFTAACAAARRAIGTRNGLQET